MLRLCWRSARRAGILAVVAYSLVGCGSDDSPSSAQVNALNMATGEKRQFSSPNEVPAGWAICSDAACAIFPVDFPCQNLGPGACILNKACRLKLRCEFDLTGYGGAAATTRTSEPTDLDRCLANTAAGGTTDSTGNLRCGGTPPQPDPALLPSLAPSGCEFACVSGQVAATCGEITDPASCRARTDCAWEEAPIKPLPLTNLPDATCTKDTCWTLPPVGYCHDQTVQGCEVLDQASCTRRDDCVWSAATCPLDCTAAGCAAPCKPFCQPRLIEPGCPEIAPPPCPNAANGKPIFDEKGCISGYDCQPIVCPEMRVEKPECPNGRIQPVADERGCVLGYTCIQDCTTPIPPPPACDSGAAVPERSSDGCIVNFTCPPAPTTACDQLQASYKEVLQLAKSCLGYPTATLVNQCSLTVPSGLGCGGCPTIVNVSNGDAVTKLKTLQDEWLRQGCDRDRMCPAMACLAPRGASCVVDARSNSGIGSCLDASATP